METIENLARELCKLLGKNPDTQIPCVLRKDSDRIVGGFMPSWKNYVGFIERIPRKREERLENGLTTLMEYAKERRALEKDCDAVFVERCAYTHLQEPS